MTNVRTRKCFASIAITRLINGTLIAGEGCVHHIQASFGSKGGVVTGETCWQYTVKDINATHHAVNQIFWCPDSHQVARLVLRQKRSDHIKCILHLLFGFTHRESSNCDAGRIERSDECSGSSSKVCLNATL